jgi:galactose mutarotase-like enzyme
VVTEAPATLRAGELEATFVPATGMVGTSLRHRGVELLSRLRSADAFRERGFVAGIPLLHPWANRLGGFTYEAGGRTVALEAGMPRLSTEGHGLPIHGLVAAYPGWRVVHRGKRQIVAELDYAADPGLLAAFPFPHLLRYEATLDEHALTIALTLIPGGEGPVPVAFGFHPYFALRGERAAAVVSVPARRHLPHDSRGLPTGEQRPVEPWSGPLGDRVLDDLYTDLTGEPFTLTTEERTIAVRFLEGFPYAQVFAPKTDPVVCFEPMTAPADALRTGEGLRLVSEPFTARFAIEVSRPWEPVS